MLSIIYNAKCFKAIYYYINMTTQNLERTPLKQ